MSQKEDRIPSFISITSFDKKTKPAGAEFLNQVFGLPTHSGVHVPQPGIKVSYVSMYMCGNGYETLILSGVQ